MHVRSTRRRLLRVASLACLVAIPAAVAVDARQETAPSISLNHLARAIQPGEAVIVRVVSTVALTTARVSILDRATEAVRLMSAGGAGEVWQAIVGIDVAAEPGPATVRVDATSDAHGTLVAEGPVVVEPKEFRQRRLRVAPKYVSPPAAVGARIAREARRLTAIYETHTREYLCTPPFARPVRHRLNSPFGSQSIFNGEVRGRHLGVDFASPAGAEIHAPAPGRVVLADDLYYTGQTVVIDHGQGVHSILAHMRRISVEDGVRVATGDVLGEVGATGRSSGPHLHWSVRIGTARVDPMSLVDVP